MDEQIQTMVARNTQVVKNLDYQSGKGSNKKTEIERKNYQMQESQKVIDSFFRQEAEFRLQVQARNNSKNMWSLILTGAALVSVSMVWLKMRELKRKLII